jgi:tetratricopeptide (TPR) repeat protein
MYPHLTPYGIIMKINRQPLPELSEEIVKRDHQFWANFSERLIGNWITYDTSVTEIGAFVEKVYLRHDFSGFKGDRKFVRDDQAQKAFSKLRSSIGGVYSWRIGASPPGSPQHQRMIKEADFAFRQAFAFCPYSPEAVFRYVNLLLGLQRFDDALIVAETCQKLDPYNGQVIGLIKQLQSYKKQTADLLQAQSALQQMENEVRANRTNFQLAFNLAATYMQMQQTSRAAQILDGILTNPNVNVQAVLTVAKAYADLRNYPRLEATLEKLVKLAPEEPEAWYDFAALKATLGKTQEALPALRRALELSDARRARNPQARDIRADLQAEQQKDDRFRMLRDTPEFKQLTAPK